MQNPTHFIEMYSGKFDGRVYQSLRLPIVDLPFWLEHTAQMRTLKTVAIFKIKAKET